MIPKFTLVCVLSVLGLIFANPASQIDKCKISDLKCIEKSAEGAFRYISGGIPELGIESSDPLYTEQVLGDVAGLKYNFTNVISDGLKTCKVSDLKLNLDQSYLHLILNCAFDIRGNYVMSGRILILPVEGNGQFSILTENLEVILDVEVALVPGTNDKKHLNIKKFTSKVEAPAPIVFKFDNLFNGNKELSTAIHTFANTNYKDVVNEFSGPLLNDGLKIFTKRVNKFLKKVPFDELTL